MHAAPQAHGYPQPGPSLSFAESMKRFSRIVFVDYWPYWAGTVAAGILNVLLFAVSGSIWGVTSEFTRWGGHLLRLAGVDVSGWLYFQEIRMLGLPWEQTSGWLVIGMFLGAFAGALVSGNFKIRVPRQKIRLLQGFVGGTLSGFGARLAMGCNLGSFFSAIPQFSFHGWLFMAGLFAGTYIGTKIALLPFMVGRPAILRRSQTAPEPQGGSWRERAKPYLGGVVFLAIGTGAAYYLATGRTDLGLFMLFGAGFGFIIERARICFTSAFRELWITRQADLARAIALGMMVATVGFAVIGYAGQPFRPQWASYGTLLGGLIFGIGIVIAGGCETGWMYRSSEGYVQLWMAGLGTITGSVILAWAWDHAGIYRWLVEGSPKVDLSLAWGWPAAILATLALLAAWFMFSTWWETRSRAPSYIRSPRTAQPTPRSR
ncbi:MAG: selenium metabolism membrane protein YedE/FdhT [Firmicutes bacterium]|nr:selenium metabolism membrane protein YedE/FdhT [Bacillota bacterium]